MTTLRPTINSLLINADIEGYIAFGAPTDEYASEAETIAEALNKLSSNECSPEQILAMLSVVWMKNFNLGAPEMQLRQNALQETAQRIFDAVTPT